MKKKILVADDQPEIVSMLVTFFEEEGYAVFSASNGTDALSMVWKEKPDLIILDVMMPGKNGFEVASMLQDDARTKKIPILMLTARDEERNEELAYNLGISHYITKPFHIETLRNKIKEILG